MLNNNLRRLGLGLAALLLASGLVLGLMTNDAVSMIKKEKEGILTAEQVNLAFQDVGGKLILENVHEGQQVKKGDLLMELDPTDTDLSIAVLEAKIKQTAGSIDIGLDKTVTAEEQSYRAIEEAKKSMDSLQATYANKKLYYRRMEQLLQQGAISQLELDNAKTNLDVSQAEMQKSQRYLEQLLAGTSLAAKAQVMERDDAEGIYLPTIDQERQSLLNEKYNVQSMEAELEQLKIQKQRLRLLAPEDGKILTIIAKQGEMVGTNMPVLLLESKRYYYDIYVSEKTAARLREGQQITGTAIANGQQLTGQIRLITPAPGFADLKMSREKGQADLTSFQVRIYVQAQEGILPGMTMQVSENELL